MFLSLAMVGIGSFAGALIDRLSFPHVARIFDTCASSRQFLVEFRTDEHAPEGTSIPGLVRRPLNVPEVTLEADGVKIGDLERYDSVRHFLCEGNHKARLRYIDYRGDKFEHAVDFAVSRPSLFHVTASSVYPPEVSATCVSKKSCPENIALELSPWEPDDVKVRLFPAHDTPYNTGYGKVSGVAKPFH